METETNTAISEKPKVREAKKLYRVISIIPEWPHRDYVYKDVKITWLVDRDEPPVPYHEAILDYEPSQDGLKLYEEMTIDELFTKAEATIFAAYLLEAHDDDATIEEVILPLDCKNTMSLSAMPVGGNGPDRYQIYKEPEYSFDFKIKGYYDVRGYECIGVSAGSFKRGVTTKHRQGNSGNPGHGSPGSIELIV